MPVDPKATDYGSQYLAKVMQGTHDDDVAAGMQRAGKYMRGMNSMAPGGLGTKSAGQYGADVAQDQADYANKVTGRKVRD